MDDQIEEGVKTTDELAEEDLIRRLKLIEKLDGKSDIKHRSMTIARNVLHEDLGHFGEPESSYHLDEKTRDRLIAHARQDAANSMCLIGDLLENIQTLEGRVRWITTTVVINLVLTIILVVGFMESM